MPAEKLKTLLDNRDIPYVTIVHSPAYTAQEVAAFSHVPGREFAKTVIVKLDGQMAMVVSPATRQVNFDSLKSATGASTAELCTENEFKDKFPGCELGAMPPFGNLYGMPVYVTKPLTDDEQISFNGGSHTELIKLSYRDWESLVHPTVVDVV